MSDNYLLYDPAAFGALEIKEDTRDAEILRLRAENEKLRAENEKLVAQSWVVDGALLSEREENERLRAALKPFADAADDFIAEKHDAHWAIVTLGDVRAAAAALKETGDE